MSRNKTFSYAVHEVMSKNEKFLLKNFRDVMDEIVELANDAIDYAYLYAKQDKGGKLYTERAVYFYTFHVLMPGSNALLVSLLSGNLPACFRELRFMIEVLAKCYLADLHHADLSFFEKRLHVLQYPGRNKKRIPEIDFVKEFAESTKTEDRIIELWKSLSEETHAKKFVERVVDNVIKHDNIPAYALVIPMIFRGGDKHDLKDLNEYVVSFRKILNETMPR